MVIYLTTHHHIHVARKERKRTQAIWVAVVIGGERTDQVVFYLTFRGSIHFLRWITWCNTCMNGYVVPIRRDWDQFYGLTYVVRWDAFCSNGSTTHVGHVAGGQNTLSKSCILCVTSALSATDSMFWLEPATLVSPLLAPTTSLQSSHNRLPDRKPTVWFNPYHCN